MAMAGKARRNSRMRILYQFDFVRWRRCRDAEQAPQVLTVEQFVIFVIWSMEVADAKWQPTFASLMVTLFAAADP